jgi:hypothetical protein
MSLAFLKQDRSVVWSDGSDILFGVASYRNNAPARAFNGDGTPDRHTDKAAHRLRFERSACPDCLRHRAEHNHLDQTD